MIRLATIAPFGFDDFSTPTFLERYCQLGCVTGQFYRNPEQPPTNTEILDIFRGSGLTLDSIHGLFGDEYDPSSPDTKVRQFAMDVYRREGELALDIGGPMVVVHPAPLVPPDQSLTETQHAERESPLMHSLEDLAKIGEEMGVAFLMENLPGNAWQGHDPIRLAEMLRQFDTPALRMCYDVGHANMTGNVAESLAACADVISYLHIHDNNGKTDSHLIPGDGAIDWSSIRSVLSGLALDVPAMYEVFYDDAKLVTYLTPQYEQQVKDWLTVEA